MRLGGCKMLSLRQTPFELCQGYGCKNPRWFPFWTIRLTRLFFFFLCALGFWQLKLPPYLSCHVALAYFERSTLEAGPQR